MSQGDGTNAVVPRTRYDNLQGDRKRPPNWPSHLVVGSQADQP
jgi:hypothetical protein